MSITVSKKSYRRLFVLGCISALLLVCFSCSLESNFPLSYLNNCHEARLEGTWICKNKDGEGQLYCVIRDKGAKYMALLLPLNDNKEVEKSEFETYTFILTKLDSYYFISVKNDNGEKGEDERPDWDIYRIQFKDNKFLVLGLEFELSEESDEKTYRKISQRELQQWCVRNANLFTVEEFCLEREKR